MHVNTTVSRRACGRPPKFQEPRRPVTVTLPERTLRQLEAVDPDRAQAIVKLTESTVGRDQAPPRSVELVEVAPGEALIVVGPCASLRRIPWLKLVEIAPGRNLLIIPSGMAVDSLEVAILDVIEHLPPADQREREMLAELRAQLGRLRRESRISKAEVIFFDVSGAGRGRAPDGASAVSRSTSRTRGRTRSVES